MFYSSEYQNETTLYSSAPTSVGNMFQDLPRLCETTDNIEHYM
jgi:hypothetical protein